MNELLKKNPLFNLSEEEAEEEFEEEEKEEKKETDETEGENEEELYSPDNNDSYSNEEEGF